MLSLSINCGDHFKAEVAGHERRRAREMGRRGRQLEAAQQSGHERPNRDHALWRAHAGDVARPAAALAV
jgi:hypothetical protein